MPYSRSARWQLWQWISCAAGLNVLASCSSVNHAELCNKAIVDSHQCLAMKDFDGAQDHLDRAKKEAQLAEPSTMPLVLKAETELAEAKGDAPGQEKYSRELLDLIKAPPPAGSSRFTLTRWAEENGRASLMLGDALRRQGKVDEALSLYREAHKQVHDQDGDMMLTNEINDHYFDALHPDPNVAVIASSEHFPSKFKTTPTRKEIEDLRAQGQWEQVMLASTALEDDAQRSNNVDLDIFAKANLATGYYMLGEAWRGRIVGGQALGLIRVGKVVHGGKIVHATSPDLQKTQVEVLVFLALTETSADSSRKNLREAASLNIDETIATLNLAASRYESLKDSQALARINATEISLLSVLPPTARHEMLERIKERYLKLEAYSQGAEWFNRQIEEKQFGGEDLAQAKAIAEELQNAQKNPLSAKYPI